MVGEELPYAYFATPEGEGPFPVIIVLGGSEGGDMGSRSSAPRFIEQGYYECPVFSCTTRGASNTNAIFGASIKMKEGDKKEKWISAACCLLFSED